MVSYIYISPNEHRRTFQPAGVYDDSIGTLLGGDSCICVCGMCSIKRKNKRLAKRCRLYTCINFTLCSPYIPVLVFTHSNNECTIIIKLSLVPYICFGPIVAIIRGNLLYVYIYTSLYTV
jgi:hypothetical protein